MESSNCTLSESLTEPNTMFSMYPLEQPIPESQSGNQYHQTLRPSDCINPGSTSPNSPSPLSKKMVNLRLTSECDCPHSSILNQIPGLNLNLYDYASSCAFFAACLKTSLFASRAWQLHAPVLPFPRPRNNSKATSVSFL